MIDQLCSQNPLHKCEITRESPVHSILHKHVEITAHLAESTRGRFPSSEENFYKLFPKLEMDSRRWRVNGYRASHKRNHRHTSYLHVENQNYLKMARGITGLRPETLSIATGVYLPRVGGYANSRCLIGWHDATVFFVSEQVVFLSMGFSDLCNAGSCSVVPDQAIRGGGAGPARERRAIITRYSCVVDFW